MVIRKTRGGSEVPRTFPFQKYKNAVSMDTIPVMEYDFKGIPGGGFPDGALPDINEFPIYNEMSGPFNSGGSGGLMEWRDL